MNGAATGESAATEGSDDVAEALRAPALGPARHGFFTRRGGVSTGLHASLNCGPGSDDDPAAVAENRRRVAAALDLGPEALTGLHQVHSADVVHAAAPWGAEGRPRADGLVTATPGVGLVVLAADCAPVLLHDAEAGVIGAAHAGWRGALGGVIEATVAAMVALGADPARTAAVVGPCISQINYEVGPEFLEAFLDEDPDHARFFAGDPGARPHFDLPGFCLSRLRAAGVERSEWIGRCTYADEARFYSHRRGTHRGEADHGRLAAAIALP